MVAFVGDQALGTPRLDPAATWGWCVPMGGGRGLAGRLFSPWGTASVPVCWIKAGQRGRRSHRLALPASVLDAGRGWPCPPWTAKGKGGAVSQGCQSDSPIGLLLGFFSPNKS